MSQLFARTLRDAPSGAEMASHRLLLRAGYIHQLGAGIFTLLPLGRQVSDRVEAILRQEMDRIGGQELSMPVVNPADVWKETGRYHQIGEEMGRFQDRGGRDMVLAMTHEEVVATLARDVIQSYRQLPQLLYHLQTKWRDDPRPRAGLIRVREFVMKDSYSLDADAAGLDRQYDAHHRAYHRIFRRCGLPVVDVLADVGMMGGSASHEFMYLTPAGEDTLLLCDACGHRANRQVATFRKPTAEAEDARPLERVETPGVTTIASLADFLGVPSSRTAKAVFQVATIVEDDAESDRLVFAVVRGDMELSETKLRNAVGARDLRPATDEEIRAAGAVPGYASPVGIEGVTVVVDDLVKDSPNLVAGANEEGWHLLHVNFGRDFGADLVTDLVAADEGLGCPDCGEPLHTRRGVEVGNIFKLGTRYTEALGCRYLDADGRERPVWMGSYGIGSGRLLACIAEEHHDEDGLVWPMAVAPYQVHIVSLAGGDAEAERLYASLADGGWDVLWDDRNESAGVKFKDADLLGVPIRLTVSGRSLEKGGVELKLRRDSERRIVALADVGAEIEAVVSALEAETGA
ncbi:MAG TPA: proline--tRNA ligase [Longimicrobiales bacterium]